MLQSLYLNSNVITFIAANAFDDLVLLETLSDVVMIMTMMIQIPVRK